MGFPVDLYKTKRKHSIPLVRKIKKKKENPACKRSITIAFCTVKEVKTNRARLSGIKSDRSFDTI